LLNSNLFNQEKTSQLQKAVKLGEEELNVTMERVTKELLNARVRMAAIGSSHKLYPDRYGDRKPSLLVPSFNVEVEEDEESILDEAGCIPAYELLGLYSLRRSIKCIVCVGDKHQLPPYAPNARQNAKEGRTGGCKVVSENVISILDVSDLEKTTGKVLLKTQYRVPADIATILNGRVYSGNYNTAKTANVPLEGFQFVDVPCRFHETSALRKDQKYINRNEIDECIKILRELQRDTERKSIMILTPVSAFEVIIFDFKRSRFF
jgi:hypothetical protein